jgi:hypothetical protein
MSQQSERRFEPNAASGFSRGDVDQIRSKGQNRIRELILESEVATHRGSLGAAAAA